MENDMIEQKIAKFRPSRLTIDMLKTDFRVTLESEQTQSMVREIMAMGGPDFASSASDLLKFDDRSMDDLFGSRIAQLLSTEIISTRKEREEQESVGILILGNESFRQELRIRMERAIPIRREGRSAFFDVLLREFRDYIVADEGRLDALANENEDIAIDSRTKTETSQRQHLPGGYKERDLFGFPIQAIPGFLAAVARHTPEIIEPAVLEGLKRLFLMPLPPEENLEESVSTTTKIRPPPLPKGTPDVLKSHLYHMLTEANSLWAALSQGNAETQKPEGWNAAYQDIGTSVAPFINFLRHISSA